MWPYSWTHVGTPSHLGHMDRVAATMPSQAHAGAAQEAPNIGQWEGQDVPMVRPSSCTVKGGVPSSRRYLPTYPRAARRPVRVSLTLARLYAIPRGLCVPRAWSGCPSGSPRLPFACVCARAPAASTPPPPGWCGVRTLRLPGTGRW